MVNFTPKTQISSVDLFFLVRELSSALVGGRLEKAYQLGEKELKLKVYTPSKGSVELVITPTYVCESRFQRKAPEVPSSFAMQLRKNLENAFIRGIRQHSFDRILEISFERGDAKFVLVCEFFSRGNIVLCDGRMKIVGLLEWQKWKDRMLGVGQTYDYPPETRNPLELHHPVFADMIKSSGKKLVAFLATDAGLGGIYAEEVCLLCGIAKDIAAKELSEDEAKGVYDCFMKVTGKIKGAETRPAIVYSEGRPVDVIPLELEIYEGFEKKEFDSFNEAVDEYFSREEFEVSRKRSEEVFQKEAEKLHEIESRQEAIISKYEIDAIEMRNAGDLIYQNLGAVDEILRIAREERKKGHKLSDLIGEFSKKDFYGVKVVELGEDGWLAIEV